jgi:hypothetical protein
MGSSHLQQPLCYCGSCPLLFVWMSHSIYHTAKLYLNLDMRNSHFFALSTGISFHKVSGFQKGALVGYGVGIWNSLSYTLIVTLPCEKVFILQHEVCTIYIYIEFTNPSTCIVAWGRIQSLPVLSECWLAAFLYACS